MPQPTVQAQPYMDTSRAERDSDEDRTKRAFIGFLSSALGVDNVYTGDDTGLGTNPGQYSIANPDGTVSVLGQPVSNTQRGAAPTGLTITPGLLLLIGLVLYLAS